jgi:hypothetical protein
MNYTTNKLKLISLGTIAILITIAIWLSLQTKRINLNINNDSITKKANLNRSKSIIRQLVDKPKTEDGGTHLEVPSKTRAESLVAPTQQDSLPFTFVDTNGRETSIEYRNSNSVSDLLDSKNSLDPLNEFESLTEIDFSNNKSMLFSGLFIDQKNQFKLAILIDPITKKLDLDSCIESNSNQNTLLPKHIKSLELRDDQSGYSILKINDNRILKLGYSFEKGRILTGKLYTRNGADWVQESDLRLTEIEEDSEDKTRVCGFGY